MRTRALCGHLLLAALLTSAATACGDDSSAATSSGSTAAAAAAAPTTTATPGNGTQTAAFANTFVGKLAGTDAYVAVAFDGDKAWAYLCDGTGGDSGELANYLTGSHRDGTVDVKDDEGVALRATIDGETVSGSATLPDGTSATFALGRASGDAAWLSATAVSATKVETGSWIRLADGSVRGKVVAVNQGADGTSPGEPDQLGDGGTPPPAAEPTGAIRCFLANRKVFKTPKPTNENDQTLLDAAIVERNRACA